MKVYIILYSLLSFLNTYLKEGGVIRFFIKQIKGGIFMSKNKQEKRVLSLLLTLVMVLGCFASFAYAEDDQLSLPEENLNVFSIEKITDEVKEDIDSEDLLEVLVYMKDQIDVEKVSYKAKSRLTSAVNPHQSKLKVRNAVIDALQDNAEMTQADIQTYLEQEMEKGNVIEFTPYHIVNIIYVKAKKEVIGKLSYMPEVEKIYKNRTYTLDVPETNSEAELSATGVEWNIETVKADKVWDLGYDGTGIVVATIDSGVKWDHPALKNKWRGYDPATGRTNSNGNWFDPVYNSSLPADSDSHGTHVMGTMVGQESNGSNKIGVAPGAKWIAARVFNKYGSTTDKILLDAAQWMLAPGGDPKKAPDIINNSWGGGAGIDDWYRRAVINWRAAGIFPVFAAGNQRKGEPAPWPGSISCPSNYPESFAVAATDRNNVRAYFSKLGPSPYDETLIKPNISAPGVNIRSSIPSGYGNSSGTSMAAPAISGVAALLLSANNSLSVEELERIITSTAMPLTDTTYPRSPNFGYGYGMVDAFKAVSSVVR